MYDGKRDVLEAFVNWTGDACTNCKHTGRKGTKTVRSYVKL